MRLVAAIVGATATGKTDLAEALAEALGGEVVNADARQVFRELEIGTGKPTRAQRAARPHHLFDLLALGERASAGTWAAAARAACEDVFARGRAVVLVGGSGLYVNALRLGLHAEPPHDAALRAALDAEREALGIEALHARLATLDPPTAARLAPRDAQRITRALEVHAASGRPLSWWHARERAGLAADWRVLETTCPPDALAARIEARTAGMFRDGLVEETAALLDAGLRGPLAKLRAIGYDEAMGVADGHLTLAEARARTDARTRQLAKRQRTWFRHQVAGERLDVHEMAPPAALRAALAALRLG